MQSDAEKIKYFRKNLGLNQTQFAESLGISQAAIANIENKSRNVSPAIALALLKKYGWDFEEDKVEDILAERETGLGIQPDTKSKKPEYYGFKKEEQGYECNFNVIPIPFYLVKAAAGNGETLSDYPEKDVIYFDARWLKNIIGINAKHATIIQAKGDSMDSGQNKIDDIKDGDLLMVDDSVKEIINNKIFVIRLSESELVVKRVFQEFDGTISLISNNPKYADRVISECDSAVIIGKVVWNGSKENI